MDSSDSLSSRMSRLFMAWPGDGATRLLVGGILLVVVGLSLATYRWPRAS